jgi:diguanylate cyclase (GGDEF)-like protein/PAS domain S-box-containing protein
VADFVGQDALSFIHPEDLERGRDRIAAAHAGTERFRAGEDAGLLQRVRTASGEYRWVRATARAMDGEAGRPGALAVGWHDVDSLVRANEELVRTRLSRDEAAIGLVITDAAGTITYANDALARMTGVQAEDIIGVGVTDGALPEEQASLTALVDRVLRGESEREHARRSLQHLTGTRAWVDSYVSPVRDVTGRVDGLLVQVVDVTAEVANREALVRSAEHFRFLAENASDVVYETDTHGLIVWVSPSVERALGWEPDTLIGTRAVDLVHPQDRDEVNEARARVYAGVPQQSIVVRFQRVDGGVRHMSVSARPLHDAEGRISGAVVGLRDVTDEIRVRGQLERSERTFRTAMVGAPQGMAMANVQDLLTDVNPALEVILGEEKARILGRRLAEFVGPSDPPESSCAERLIASGESRVVEHEHLLVRRAEDGGERWVAHTVSAIRDDDGTALFFVHHLQDVTGRHRREEELGFRASHDLLTGLLNREGLYTRLQDWLPVRGHGGLAVLFCDLDGLKGINDAHGHAAGDAVLAAIAHRLEAEVRRGDIVARHAGDEFIVVIDRIQSREDVLALAEKVCAGAAGPVAFEGVDLPAAVSIGIALAEPGEDADPLIARADQALYRAKQAGRGRVSD